MKIGEKMSFLFDIGKDDGQNKKILFVTHDFLHRVPLHGTLISKDTASILLEKFNCTYLPALSYATIDKNLDNFSAEPILLQYYSETDQDKSNRDAGFDTLSSLNLIDQKSSTKSASTNDLKNIVKNINDGSAKLAIRCHGKSDNTNPFFSKLCLKEEIKLIDIANMIQDFSNLQIFLGACETDLMSPLISSLDEQLSIASIFLNKGAQNVAGTMWEISDQIAINILVANKTESFKNLPAIQKKDILEYFKNKKGELSLSNLFSTEENHRDKKFFFDNICFRLYGV